MDQPTDSQRCTPLDRPEGDAPEWTTWDGLTRGAPIDTEAEEMSW